MSRYALVEAGGTKFVLGIADADGAIGERTRIATTDPAATLGAATAWFAARGPFARVGIGSFGPLDLDRASPDWGALKATPKPGWTGAGIAAAFAGLGAPVAIDTDVNAAALAEARWGAGVGLTSLLYLTIGTGIGGGYVQDGRLVGGLAHPEMGHIAMPRHAGDAGFNGVCPFHGACLEGLASGPAIAARWGRPLSQLGADQAAMIAWYLGHAVASFQAVLQPTRIVLGGGVMATPGLLDAVRGQAALAGGGYFAGDPAQIVVAPGLAADSGLRGALALIMGPAA